MPKVPKRILIHRFLQKCKITKSSECWIWTAGKNGKGYGYIWTGPNRKGDIRQAYKVGYELFRGKVPIGRELHHTCENPACVNPWHLKSLSVKQHRKIGTSVVARNAQKKECVRGHKFTAKNTAINPNGARRCRACSRIHSAASRKVKVDYSL